MTHNRSKDSADHHVGAPTTDSRALCELLTFSEPVPDEENRTPWKVTVRCIVRKCKRAGIPLDDSRLEDYLAELEHERNV